MQDRILILIGDEISRFVQATGALKDIRTHYPNAHITLLAHRSLKKLASTCPWVDDISYDAHIPLWPNPLAHLQHRIKMKAFLGQFQHVFDFQHNSESNRYLKLDGPEKSANKWCSCHAGAHFRIHPQALQENPLVDIFRIQLSLARVPSSHKPDITYLANHTQAGLHTLPKGYVVFIPGSRRTHIERRWPHYLELGKLLKQQGIPMVIIGSTAEEELAIDLAKTLDAPLMLSLHWPELVHVFQNARYVVGNDTGPFYLAIASGAQGTILYGPDITDRRRHAPKNTAITVLEHNRTLAALSAQQVIKTIPLR